MLALQQRRQASAGDRVIVDHQDSGAIVGATRIVGGLGHPFLRFGMEEEKYSSPRN
jgi:hypothetical protein